MAAMSELTDERILNTKILLRPDEAARILGISKRTVYNLYYNGRISAVKIRGSLRIRSESIRRLLEEAEE